VGVPFFPNSRAEAVATAAQTELAAAVVKLFKAGFEPTPATLVAELDAEECDFDDYAPETITAWLDPAAAETGGWRITAPTVQFLCTAAQVVGNMVGGFWIELAGGAVVLVQQFDNAAPMTVAGDSVQITPTIVYGNGT
jgi:hypothetical protein